MTPIWRKCLLVQHTNSRLLSKSVATTHKCKLLIVGGGTGGCSIAWRFSKILDKNDIIVLEPSNVHYFQPMFLQVAAGLRRLDQSQRDTQSVLPPATRWLQDAATHFEPCSNIVCTRNRQTICYDYMVVAVGLKNDYEKIPGLKTALDDPDSGVSTIYAPEYCGKAWCCAKELKCGHTVFTGRPVKCQGAALSYMFLTEDLLRKHKTRPNVGITYTTCSESIFGVSKYMNAIKEIARQREIALNCELPLAEVRGNHAVFNCIHGGQELTLPFSMLHVTPPMSTPSCLANCRALANDDGYLDIDKHTLQHNNYYNIYGLGDCTNTPNSKTALAIGPQSRVVEVNLIQTMSGRQPAASYDGYSACPLMTSRNAAILAEFDYNKKPRETFPFDQSKTSRLLSYLIKSYLPRLYWNKIIKGKWDGPESLRKKINPLKK